MSVNAQTIINEAAALVGDPEFSRIFKETWRVILNQSQRDLARKMRIKLYAVTFDIVAQDEYALPDDCINIKWMRWNSTPSNRNTWRELREKFEDEFRAMTDNTYPDGDPAFYFPLVETFHLVPRPTTTVVGGGKLWYWGLPDDVVVPETQPINVIDVLRDSLRDRMLVYGLRRLEKFDAATEAEKEWQTALGPDRDRLEDRSQDRRTRLRAGTRWTGER